MPNKRLRKYLVTISALVGIVVCLQMIIKTGNAAKSDISWPNIEILPWVTGLSSPVHIANAGDGSNRLFVVERIGRIRIIEGGVLSVTPFLNIQGRVQSSGGEEGLLSVAFPPDYGSKGYFFVYYTNKNGDNQVSRFSISTNDDLANPDSEQLILYLDHPDHANHNGGQLAFGPDGYLYISTGDGGGGGDPEENAQNPASLLGKILRIDVDMAQPAINHPYVIFLPLVLGGDGIPVEGNYRIPIDNPFVGVAGYRGEIWALGLRNPWRFSFNQENGDLYIGDVGQGSWEEIDFQPATSLGGENYGWNEMEGSHCYLPNCETSGMTLPVFEYPTHVEGSCAVTGGVVYRGPTYINMQDIYYFADYCNGFIMGLHLDGAVWQEHLLLDTNINISSFGEDEAGEIFLADNTSGTIFQITAQTP